MFSIQYRQRYKHALKLQRWPLVDTAKMEKEKKENTPHPLGVLFSAPLFPTAAYIINISLKKYTISFPPSLLLNYNIDVILKLSPML